MFNETKSKEILLESLLFPVYAKPEFLIQKQQQSGWSKNVFLSSLRDVYTGMRNEVAFLINRERKSNRDINEIEIGLSLEKATNGQIKEVNVDYGKKSKVINTDVLDMLLQALNEADQLGNPDISFTDLQIITLFETALRFIKFEFEVQAGLKEDSIPFSRHSPKGFSGQNKKGETVYLLHEYYIKGPKPLFDITIFKHSLRNLLINSQHPENLASILKPRIADVKEVVRIWNEILHPLSQSQVNSVTHRRLIEFHKFEDWTIWYDAKFQSFQEKSYRFPNIHLVRFAFEAGNLIANEVLPEEEENKKIKQPQATPTLKSIFLTESAYHTCIELFDFLEITIDGENRLKKGRIGRLIGAIDAMKQTPGIFKIDTLTEEELLYYFNSHLGTSYKTYSKRNDGYEESKDSALRYLKNNFKK